MTPILVQYQYHHQTICKAFIQMNAPTIHCFNVCHRSNSKIGYTSVLELGPSINFSIAHVIPYNRLNNPTMD